MCKSKLFHKELRAPLQRTSSIRGNLGCRLRVLRLASAPCTRRASGVARTRQGRPQQQSRGRARPTCLLSWGLESGTGREEIAQLAMQAYQREACPPPLEASFEKYLCNILCRAPLHATLSLLVAALRYRRCAFYSRAITDTLLPLGTRG